MTLAAISSLTLGYKRAKPHKDKPLIKRVAAPQPNLTWEDRFHTIIEQKVDHLLGDRRGQQLQQLNGVTPEISAETKHDNRHLAITGLNAAAAIVLDVIAPSWLSLSLPVSLYFARNQFKMAWRSMMHERKLNVYTVDVVAATITLVTGLWMVMALNQFLFAIALKLLNRVKQQSRQQLVGMFVQTPTSVWVLQDTVEIETKLKDLQADSIVVVHAGEVIPVDGVILQGSALIDQRALTGESQPAEKQIGDEVFASTLLLSGQVQLRVQNTGQFTVAARIGEMLEKTAGYKNQHEFQAEQFANRSVAPTLLLSIAALPVSGISGSIGVLWSCLGYNMRITSPMSVMNFLSTASHHQILIKDGRVLDTLPQIDTVVFDKTGTLTEEEPELYQIHCFTEHTEALLLSYAAAVEYRQTHPIARAILAAAATQGLLLPGSQDSHCKLGYGIEASIGEQRVHLGSYRFMQHSGIPIPDVTHTIQTAAETAGHSLVMLSIDGVLAGALELRPQIRPSTYSVIQALKQQGIHTCILSGDHESPTRHLSEILGIDQYFADTLPEQKAAVIQKLQDEGRKVCFVGDGINDAIALKQANISVSLSGATRAATDTAQIILMDADLAHLVSLLDMGQQFQQNQQQNRHFSVIPAVASIAGIFFVHGGLVLAGVMFYSGMGLGVKNAMRPVHLQRFPTPFPAQQKEIYHADSTATQTALSSSSTNFRTNLRSTGD